MTKLLISISKNSIGVICRTPYIELVYDKSTSPLKDLLYHIRSVIVENQGIFNIDATYVACGTFTLPLREYVQLYGNIWI